MCQPGLFGDDNLICIRVRFCTKVFLFRGIVYLLPLPVVLEIQMKAFYYLDFFTSRLSHSPILSHLIIIKIRNCNYYDVKFDVNFHHFLINIE